MKNQLIEFEWIKSIWLNNAIYCRGSEAFHVLSMGEKGLATRN